jgi:hypothetical protein
MTTEEPYYLVVRAGDVFERRLEGMPTPGLIDACGDGRAHEAWPAVYPDSPGFVQWRLRDDAYDATHKPAAVPYVRVRVGLNPRRDR